MFCYPGGGYGRGYYDIRGPGLDGYSEAEHHAERGIVLVACDPLGVGESSDYDRAAASYEAYTETLTVAVRDILRVLEDEHGISPPVTIGAGQSYGGFLLAIQQARQAPSDGIAMLGYSAIHTVIPLPPGTSEGWDRPWAFHWHDVPDELVAAEQLDTYPHRDPMPVWASGTLPGGPHWNPMLPGVIAKWARVIESPVLIALGERDVCPDPHAEPGAYASSSDVTLYICPRMAHMHNLAGTRHLYWDRLADWSRTIARLQ